MNRENIMLVKNFEFAVAIVKLSRIVDTDKNMFFLSNNRFKSGTRIEANAVETRHDLTKKGFEVNMSITPKEAGAVSYWLRFIKKNRPYFYQSIQYPALKSEILKIRSSIIKNNSTIYSLMPIISHSSFSNTDYSFQ
jgi:four helix bundle protein